MTRSRAVAELVVAGAFWGFGFVATVWGLRLFSPIQFLLWRFFFSWIFGEIFYYLFFSKSEPSRWWQEFKLGAPVGLLLGLVLLLQTIGLKFTTATQSGFITTLYVILVPLFQHLFFKKKQSLKVFLYAFVALVGTYFLTGGSFSQMNQGDLWTLGCSVMAAFHIIYVGTIMNRVKSPFRINTMQSLICFMMMLTLTPIDSQKFEMTSQWLPWVGLAFTVFGSTIIGFTIQIRTQKILSPATASMLFLLESPFALLFGFLLLGERLDWLQSAGALVILISAILTIQNESP